MPKEWSDWVLRSDGALRVSRAIRAVAGAGLVGAAAVVVGTLITGERFHHPGWLLLPGIPILAAGQVWTVAILVSRAQVDVPARDRRWMVRVMASDRQGWRLFFGGLPRGQATFFVLLLVAAAASSYGADNGPGPPSQRFAAGVFMAFYAVHAGVSSAELARRSSEDFARARGFSP